MIFEQIATGGCQSYLVGCADTCAAALIDPEISQIDRYLALAARDGLRIRYRHRHAHPRRPFLGDAPARATARRADRDAPRQPGAVRRHAGRRRRDDRRRQAAPAACCTRPGHTRDSMCLVVEDRVFTGDTLLIGGTGRTDLPSGDPDALYDSLFDRLLKLDPALLVYPGARLQGPRPLDASAPRSPTIRACRSATAPPSSQMMREPQPDDADAPHRGAAHQHERRQDGRAAARRGRRERALHVAGRAATRASTPAPNDLIVLDVRERDAYEAGHIPGARLLPRGQLELRVNQELPDPTRAHPHLLRVRPHLDAGRGDAARDGLSARGRARRRHEGLARSGLSDEGRAGAVSAAAPHDGIDRCGARCSS